MQIIYQKKFTKKFKKLPAKIQEKVKTTIRRFQLNQFDPKLRNHGLKGKLKGKRAISVTGDTRIIFEEWDNYVIVLMLDLGPHNNVY